MRSGGDSTLDPRCGVVKEMPTMETSGACYGTAIPQRKVGDVEKPAEDYRWPVSKSFYMSTGMFRTFGMFINGENTGITNQQILNLEIAGNCGCSEAMSGSARFFANIRDNNSDFAECNSAQLPWANEKNAAAVGVWRMDCGGWTKEARRKATAGLLREMRPDNYKGREIDGLVPAFIANGLEADGAYRDHVREHIKNPSSLVLVSVPKDYNPKAKVGDKGYYPVYGRLDFASPEEITLAIFTPKTRVKDDQPEMGMTADEFSKVVDEDVKRTGGVDFGALRKAAFALFFALSTDTPESMKKAKELLDTIPVDANGDPRKAQEGSLDDPQRKLYAWLKMRLKPTSEECQKKGQALDQVAEKCVDTVATCKKKTPPLPYDETNKVCGAACTEKQVVNAKGKCAAKGGGGGGDWSTTSEDPF